MRKSLIILTGVNSLALDAALVTLLWDLPRAVAIRHTIDPVQQSLTRVVSAMDGQVESELKDLEHACVGCALRQDIIPSIVRLARDDQWDTIVACLPVSAEADHLSSVISSDPDVARYVRLATVISVLDTDDIIGTLLSTELLHERNLHTGPEDDRGLGETACAQVEYADVVVTTTQMASTSADFLNALRRPSSVLVNGVENLEGLSLIQGRHSASEARSWRTPLSADQLPVLTSDEAWRIDLQSQHPFHPERLMDHIELLGSGSFRSRGCFWVPTRPEMANSWEGAAGQVTIGCHSAWGSKERITRLIITGVGELPTHLHEIFNQVLLSPSEARLDHQAWMLAEDGLEPWLGEIRRVA